jgi:hypothetical protein
MLVIDCTDCYTKVEFKQNTVHTSFNDIDKVLIENKDSIKMFMVDDYIFEFVEYIKEGECSSSCMSGGDKIHWIIGKYITPIPHLTYMIEDEI